LPDFWIKRTRRHLLRDVLTIALCATMCGPISSGAKPNIEGVPRGLSFSANLTGTAGWDEGR
jgi:hypothetical protein